MSGQPDELLIAIHDAFAAELTRFVVHLTGDPALAEDVVQEVLVRAWQRPQVLQRSEDSVRAWLFTVARNLVVDDRRSARFRREVSVGEYFEEVWHPPYSREAEAIDAALDSWLIADALASLSHDHRVVIVSAYYLGWSTMQIAAELEIPDGTVKSRLHYALRALRLALQEKGVTE